MLSKEEIVKILGEEEASYLLQHRSEKVKKETLHIPG